MVQLPYRSESEVVVPQAIRGHENGRIPADLLQPCGLRTCTMVEPAARACRAMVAAAAVDGVRLDASNAYRSYDEQLQMFTGRYSTTPIAGRPTRKWQNVEYWLKPGVPSAAPPGQSFHGWGLAVDFDGLDATKLAWLAEHGPAFGFWTSVKTEEWHWPYFPGDDIPEVVLQFERSGKAAPAPKSPAPQPAPKTPAPKPAAPKPAASGAPRGALAAAQAAYQAGFRGADLTDITMIAGRESGWQSDRINPRTSDRGMWQINWKNLSRDGYADLRKRLGIDDEMDLLDLGKNAAVAFAMYEDSVKAGKPWFPWRASDTGHQQAGPGWDPDGSHRWRTEQFAAEAAAAAKAVLDSGGRAAPAASATPAGRAERGTYVIVASDSDGISAVVGRCLGIADAPFALRRAAAEAVTKHTGAAIDAPWKVGDTIRFPPTIDGVRCYTVRPGDGMLAITRGLGLGATAAAQQRVVAINAWQGATPHPGDTWYGGAA